MNYTIARGDNLWNIAKNNYDCKSNAEIMQVINEIAKENDIKNINMINEGAELNLPETERFLFPTVDENKTRVDEFDDWTNGEENYQAVIAGEEIEEFQMFDLDLSTYSTDLKEVAQEYIDKYDEDGDGSWNIQEFINMATAGAGIEEEYKDEYETLYNQLFEDLNIDEKAEAISAAEFASFLYTADVDWDNFHETGGDVASSIDGKLDYMNYQSFSSLEPGTEQYDNLQYQKKAFFDNFYAA